MNIIERYEFIIKILITINLTCLVATAWATISTAMNTKKQEKMLTRIIELLNKAKK